MKKFFLTLVVISFSTVACQAQTEPQLSDVEQQAFLVRAREASSALMSGLQEQLKSAIKQDGVAAAVTTCSVIAPALASQTSQSHQLKIRRVSTKNRNPQATPDAFETQALQQWPEQLNAPQAPEEHYALEMQGDKPVFRYVKAIRTQQACLQCHGQAVAAEVKQAIQKHYPQDKAFGYEIGALRGAISVEIPVDLEQEQSRN